MLFNLLLRSIGMVEDLARNGGGFELLRGGYAKCIAGQTAFRPGYRRDQRRTAKGRIHAQFLFFFSLLEEQKKRCGGFSRQP